MKDKQSDPKRRETFKKWFPVISTGAAVFFCVLWLTGSCDKPQTPPSDNELWREKVAAREAVIREKDSIIATIVKERQTDSLRHERLTSSLKQRELALVRKLKEANADIQVIADSLPKVARYIELADSTIAVKDSLYTVERNHGIATEALYKSEIAQMAARHMHQEKISSILETKIMELQDQNGKLSKRLERKKKGNRLLGGIALGLGAALGLIIATQ